MAEQQLSRCRPSNKASEGKTSNQIHTKGSNCSILSGTNCKSDFQGKKEIKTATDAETNVINKLKADQRKEHKSKPVLEKKTDKAQPNPVDEHLREMARQADEEAQKIIKRQQASFAFFESRKRKK